MQIKQNQQSFLFGFWNRWSVVARDHID